MPLLMKEPDAGPIPAETETVVGADQAAAVVARRGQLLTVTDVDGRQPAALFAITLADPREFLSPHHTRVFSNSFMLRLGMRLVTNRRRPILVLGKDTADSNDLLFPAVDRDYLVRHGYPGTCRCGGRTRFGHSPAPASSRRSCLILSISFSTSPSKRTLTRTRAAAVSGRRPRGRFAWSSTRHSSWRPPARDVGHWNEGASTPIGVRVHNWAGLTLGAPPAAGHHSPDAAIEGDSGE